jgi:hypothetical protein
MQSPSPLVTMFYYSIPSGMLGGASISIKPLERTAHSAGFVAGCISVPVGRRSLAALI